MPGLITAVADIGRVFHPLTAFAFETGTDAVAFVAGTALCITDDQLVTGIRLFAAIAMNTEIIRVIKAAPVPGIDSSVPKDFL